MMSYPMKEVISPFSGTTTYTEMTPEEYEDQLTWYRNLIKPYEASAARRCKEYASYLSSWFGNVSCDGLPDYQTRYSSHTLPMSYNVYFG